MVQLKFEQTTAPVFSASSKTLARAGLSLDRAFESAQGLLESYQTGQQEKVDNEIFSEIAGLDREGLQKYFEGNGLKGRAMSGDMREFLGKQFGVLADVRNTRATAAETLSGTTRANAIRSEQAAREADSVGALAEARAGGSVAAQASIEARLRGKTGAGGVVPNVPIPGTAPAGDAIGAALTQDDPEVSVAAVSGVPTVGGGSIAPKHLVGNESGGDFGASNESVGSGGVVGHDGRVQAGAARIEDAKKAGILPKGMTREQFRADPQAQVAFENWHFGDIDKNIEKNGYSKYIGTTINGVKVTHAGMVDVQHIGGATGLKKFLESNGAYNVEDDNNTSLTDYLRKGGAASDEANANVSVVAPQIDPATGNPVDPLSALRAVGGSLGDTIGRGTPGINRISGTGPAGATGEVIPTGPGQQGRGELSPNQVPLTAIPRGPGTPAANALGVGEGGPIVSSATETIAKAAVPVVEELVANPRKFRDAQIAAIMASKFLTGDQMISKIDALADATSAGEAEILRVRAVDRMEALVAAATKWADDPNSSLKLEDLQKILSDMPGTAVEKAAAGLFALEIGNGALAYKIKPTYIADAAVARGVQDELKRNRKTLEIQRIHQISNLARVFGDEDPATALENFVKSKNDGKAQTPYWFGIGADATAENSVRKLVAFIASEAGVTPAIAAAAMAERFTPNPQGLWDGFNTNENRFDKTGAIAWLKANANEDALRIYEGDVERVALREDELNAGGVRLGIMRHKFKKMNDSNSTVQERKDAKQAFTALQNTLKSGRTPEQGARALAKYIGDDGLGIANILAAFTPGSPEHQKAVAFVRLSINSDTKISDAHKRLLLAAINS